MNYYSFEDLDVWQKAVEFANEVISVVDKLNTDRKHFRVIEQLESAILNFILVFLSAMNDEL